jgi:integrase
MASIFKIGKRWRAQVLIGGERQGRVFDTKSEASQWAMMTEAEGRKAPAVTMLVGDALSRLHKLYVNEDKSRSDISRCKRLMDDPIAKKRLADVNKDDLIDYRDRRAKSVEDASIRRELNLIRGMFRRCREEWNWMTHNPFTGFKGPASPESRGRRITADEIARVRHAFGIGESLAAVTITNRIGLMFLFAIETAARSGEIVGLTWPHVHLDARYVHFPKTKNGDKRDVPLSSFAVQILEALPRDAGQPCFMMDDGQRDANWRKWRDQAALDDLHFHDTRAEGVWRLSKKLDVLQLARVIGHRDLKSLLIYYRESATDMAGKLD